MSTIPLPLKQRSAATNGSHPFVDKIDHRSAWMRRWKDLCAAHLNDLGGEGLSEAQVSICRRISTMEIELESLEAKMAEGKIIDPDLYGRLCGRLARMLDLVGIRRLTKPLDPTSELARACDLLSRSSRKASHSVVVIMRCWCDSFMARPLYSSGARRRATNGLHELAGGAAPTARALVGH